MRFAFRELPDPMGPRTRARPLVDVVVEGLDIAPQACLLDSGAIATRLGGWLAETLGLDLTSAPSQRIGVGATSTEGRMAEVSLRVGGHSWQAPVWFCEPWRPAFGLLGLAGFFDHFLVTIAAYDEWIELEPVGRPGRSQDLKLPETPTLGTTSSGSGRRP
jgi:Aspartyl protease